MDKSLDQQSATLVEWMERRVPFNRLLGVTVQEVNTSKVTVSLAMRDELIGNFTRGSLHGGVISAALDLVGGMAAMMAIAERSTGDNGRTTLPQLANFGTINLRVDYLRPGVGREFIAAGHTVRAGNKLVVTRMEFRNEQDDLLATGIGTYAVG